MTINSADPRPVVAIPDHLVTLERAGIVNLQYNEPSRRWMWWYTQLGNAILQLMKEAEHGTQP